MEIVQSVKRSWINDAYFSLYRPIHPEGKVRREMSWGKCPDTLKPSNMLQKQAKFDLKCSKMRWLTTLPQAP